MSKHSIENSKPTRRFRRLSVFAIIAAAMIAVAAITVISRQKLAANESVAKQSNDSGRKASASNARTFVTRHVAGQDIQIDTQSGQIKPLTPQEAQKLAEGLAPMLDRSTDGLVQVRHADGSVSMDLQGRFQDVVVARINTDGVVEQSCVNNPQAAAKFFGIDPKLIKDAQTRQKKLANPN